MKHIHIFIDAAQSGSEANYNSAVELGGDIKAIGRLLGKAIVDHNLSAPFLREALMLAVYNAYAYEGMLTQEEVSYLEERLLEDSEAAIEDVLDVIGG